MSYDGMYSDLSTRGTSSQILTLVLEARDQVLLAEENVEVLEAQTVSNAATAEGASNSAAANAAAALASATSATGSQSASAISAAAAAQSAIDAETNSEAALVVANAAAADAAAAVITANGIAGTANAALAASEQAEFDAGVALSQASNAITIAEGAVTTADNALSVANGIADTANTALTNSEAAVDTANAALAGVSSKQDGDPMLTALAAMTTTADKGLYFTGTDAPAQYPLTSYARTVLDDTSAEAARTTLGVFNAGQAHIDGLSIVYVGNKAIDITAGSCYIPGGTNNSFISPSTISLTGQTVLASTMYHVYVYYSSGTPSAEISTSSPVSYFGAARQKTGDTTRRYIGTILSDPSGNLFRFTHTDNMMEFVTIATSPFQVLSGSATTSTSVSLSGVLPVTAYSAFMIVFNQSTTNVAVRLNVPSVGAATPSGSLWGFFPSLFNGFRLQLDKGTLSVNYAFDSAPATAGVILLVRGYLFER